MVMESLLTADEVAKRLGLTANALAILRTRGKGPRYLKFGRSVRYDPTDVARWIEAHKVTPARSAS